MAEYFVLLVIHAAALVAIAYYFRKQYRSAVRASNRRVEELLQQHRVDGLEAELTYLRNRNAVLMRGLFPRGEVFPGGFIDDDPELRALADLLDLVRAELRQGDRPATASTQPGAGGHAEPGSPGELVP